MQSNPNTVGMYFSNYELRVFAELARKGEVEMEPKSDFSQMYGTKRKEIASILAEDVQRKLTLNFIKTYTAVIKHIPGIRKAKTKAMVEALRNGMAENGNHFVTCFEGDYHFYYRGTLIYKWNAVADEGGPIHAGAYEDTPSTRNQRKEIMKSIANFKEAVLGV